MAPSIAVVIREDPTKSHRAVEALRIALGLSTGGNPLTVTLLDRAPLLLSNDVDAIVDGDTLEHYIPVLKELRVTFVVQSGARTRFSLDADFHIREQSAHEIASLIAQSDRVLVF